MEGKLAVIFPFEVNKFDTAVHRHFALNLLYQIVETNLEFVFNVLLNASCFTSLLIPGKNQNVLS